jgi:tetratricopeptide (TPR) repeat protein
MEHSEPEPLAKEINIRSGAKAAKGIWSLRSVEGKSSSTIWSQGSKELDRSKSFYSLLAEARNANEERRFVQGLGAFREAAALSRTDAQLKTAAFDTALKEVKTLTAEYWRVAAAYLSEATQLDPERIVPDALSAAIQQAEREESIANTLAEIKPGGDAEQAYSRLTRALLLYRGDLSLEGQLPVVCASVVERRGPEERQRRLAIMRGLSGQLDQCTELSDVGRIERLSQSALGPYQADGEIRAVYERIRRYSEASLKASSALGTGQIASCLQVCSQVLHDAPEQRYLVSVRQKAREFRFSGEAVAVEQANELLARGPLAEALELTRHALTQFEGSTALLAMEAAISEKEATVRGLLEGGEASLLSGNFESAGMAFLQARRLLPFDPELSHYLATLLHSHARSQIDQDWRAFSSVLDLEQSLQLERPLRRTWRRSCKNENNTRKMLACRPRPHTRRRSAACKLKFCETPAQCQPSRPFRAS